MHRFDYSFLNNGMLPAYLINIPADIYALRATSWNRQYGRTEKGENMGKRNHPETTKIFRRIRHGNGKGRLQYSSCGG